MRISDWSSDVCSSDLVNRSLNMFTLIALGTGAAYVFSLAATIAPQLFPAGFRDHHGNVGVYYEAAAVIVVLVLQIGRASCRERVCQYGSISGVAVALKKIQQ